MTALHIVAMNGNTVFARYLIEKGANVNAMDKCATPLINAVEEHKQMVELLLNNKADGAAQLTNVVSHKRLESSPFLLREHDNVQPG